MNETNKLILKILHQCLRIREAGYWQANFSFYSTYMVSVHIWKAEETDFKISPTFHELIIDPTEDNLKELYVKLADFIIPPLDEEE